MMRALAERLAVAFGLLAKVSLYLSGAGLVAMTGFIAWQVYGRYILNDTPTWTGNGSVIIMGWFIILGAAVGIREGNHLSFDVLLHVLGPRAKAVLHTVSDLFVAAFSGGMIVFGVQLAQTTWNTTIPNIGISGAFNYGALIWGGVLMLLFSLERILRRLAGLPTARFGEAATAEE
jgi:TRAP-type C4-dicarboxylate transport system permease small subunit